MTVTKTDIAAYVRGRLFMAGVDYRASICDALDVLQVVMLEVPVEGLRKWRDEFERALAKVRPFDRETWGLEPEHVAAQNWMNQLPPE